MTFTTANHLDDAIRAYHHPVDERAGEIARAAIRHLYAFIEDVGLTREEWFRGIRFLTAVGQMCDERRQEFILLSDTLGASMLVEMVNQESAAGTTEPTVFGPFHVPGAPLRQMGDTIVVDDDPGPRIRFRGMVRDLDGAPVEGAELDVWQTASNGLYDVQDPDATPMNLRGRFVTGSDGRYEFETVRPVPYPIPVDGPVGDMLRTCGRHHWRPAHTHVMITSPGHKTIITHLFDADSEHLDSDPVFGVRQSLVVDMSGEYVDHDFVIEPDGEAS
jgi:catechol 1,2-dioxygenase